MNKIEAPKINNKQEKQAVTRGLSAVIEKLEKQGKLYDPLMGETHTIGHDGKIKSTETDR